MFALACINTPLTQSEQALIYLQSFLDYQQTTQESESLFLTINRNKVSRVDWLGNLMTFFVMFLFSFSLLKYDDDRTQITKGFEM